MTVLFNNASCDGTTTVQNGSGSDSTMDDVAAGCDYANSVGIVPHGAAAMALAVGDGNLGIADPSPCGGCPCADAAAATTIATGGDVGATTTGENGAAASGVEHAVSTSGSTQHQQPTRKASMSETAQLGAGGWDAPYPLNYIFERPFRMIDPNTGGFVQEATGWAMDAAARGPLNQIGSYIGSALLQLASLDAGCLSPRLCDETFAAGLKPSSMLTLISTVVGLVAALLMPIAGAIVDHTTHRKTMGIVSGFITVLVTGLQILISSEPNNWLMIAILDGIQSFGLLVHSTACFAYLPDITLDQKILPMYTAHFNIRQFLSQITVGGMVILIGQLRLRANPGISSLDISVVTARDGAAIAFTYGCVFITYSWTFLFRKRPALSQVPEDSTLITAGFKQVYNTSKKIGKEYRALRWFMFSLLWSPEAGAGVVLSICVTYFVVIMKFDSLDIAKVALTVMTSNIAGSAFSRYICRYINPLNSYRIAMSLFSLSFIFGAMVMDTPERGWAVYIFAVWVGAVMGWAYPSQRVLFCTLIPKGQETEMMGLFFFMGQILGWLPPLIFTIINENNVDMRWGLGLVSFFAVFSVICTIPMGSYKQAVELVARDSEAKLASVLEAASKHENYVRSSKKPKSASPNEANNANDSRSSSLEMSQEQSLTKKTTDGAIVDCLDA